ncbi:MAG: hypothetical protein JWP93_2029 [Polaromonas sp.]|jgi:hypothetical protein|nr:hypothetical protein [Polaromonas sp.]
MNRQNLVVARVGQNSLHPTWLSPAESRNWDLYLCPYQAVHVHDESALTLGDVIVGPKWTGLRALLNDWQGWRDYEYIWLPDDDILASQDTINRMFSLARELSFDLCAPALHEASYYAHYSTMRNRRCFARRTGFVEIMVPCFSVRALERLLPTFDLSPTGWGWGLDSLWPKKLEYQNVGIIDAAAVLHTRPVGLFRDAGLGQRVRAESDRIMQDYQCAQVHTTFAAVGKDLQDIDLPPDALTALLADGWRYLLDSNPAVLAWLVKAQQPEGGWSDYPIAGVPTSAANA